MPKYRPNFPQKGGQAGMMQQIQKLQEQLAQTQEQLAQEIADYDALVIRSRTTVSAEILKNAKKLRVIGRAGVGLGVEAPVERAGERPAANRQSQPARTPACGRLVGRQRVGVRAGCVLQIGRSRRRCR